MTLNLFLIVFTSICVVNILFYLLFSKFVFSKPKKALDSQSPISVIVYIKNQEAILETYLNELLLQTHQNFELILVNNASLDNTLDILEKFRDQYNNIHIVNVVNNEAFWGSKKYALTLGIKKAKHNQLLFTTPNSLPKSKQWFSTMSGIFGNEKEFILGYSNYKKAPGFLNRLARFSKLHNSLQNFGIAALNKPYSASQNNLSYSAELYNENNGFANQMSIPVGTEDLFTKEVANKSNVALASQKESFVSITKKITFSEWFKKRKLEVDTKKYYSKTNQFNLAIFFFSQLAFWVLGSIGCIIFPSPLTFGIIGGRFLITGLVFCFTAYKFSEKDLCYLFPFWEIINICLQISIFIHNLFSKPTT